VGFVNRRKAELSDSFSCQNFYLLRNKFLAGAHFYQHLRNIRQVSDFKKMFIFILSYPQFSHRLQTAYKGSEHKILWLTFRQKRIYCVLTISHAHNQ